MRWDDVSKASSAQWMLSIWWSLYSATLTLWACGQHREEGSFCFDFAVKANPEYSAWVLIILRRRSKNFFD